MDLFLYGILSLLIGGALALLLPEKWKIRALAFFSLAGFILVLIPSFIVLFTNRTIALGSGVFSLRTDALAAFFQMMFSSVFFFTVLYSAGYLKRRKSPADISFMLFFMDLIVICLLMLTVVANTPAFLLTWQAMLLAVFFAIVSGRASDGYRKALRYLVFLEAGFVCILTAVIIMSSRSGSLELASFGLEGKTSLFTDAMLALLFVGFGSTAGWMAKAWSGIFLPLESTLAALLTAAGIFGFMRMLNCFPAIGPLLVVILIILSIAAAVWGAVRSALQKEWYSFLAGNSILYYGMAGLGIAIGLAGVLFKNDMMSVLGFASALFQTVNHAIAKSLAYYGAGSAFPELKTVALDRPRGSNRGSASASLFLIISLLALAGLPMLNGFINYFMVSSAIVSGVDRGLLQAFLVPALVIGVLLPVLFMVPAYIRIIGDLVLGQNGDVKARKTLKVRGWLVSGVASFIMTALVLATGIFPQYAAIFAVNPASDLAKIAPALSDHTVMSVFSSLFNSLNMITKSLLTFIALALILYLVRIFALTKREFEGARLTRRKD